MDRPATAPQFALGELHCLMPRLFGTTIELPFRGVSPDGVITDFTEVVELPAALDEVDPAIVEPMLRLLSLAASLSYFKAFAPATLIVADGLTDQERRFVTELIRNGLAEFAYVNDLPEVFETEVVAPRIETVAAQPAADRPTRRVLVPVGGGKDSVVTIEAMKSAGFDVGLFSINPLTPMLETAVVAGADLHIARRQLDRELLRLNAEGAPNGHVPVTAINSLIAVLSALALGYDTVAFSNEASSSFGNVEWAGRMVNHQWSKGLDFERLLRSSLTAGAPKYVSLLRPLTELRITRRFAKHAAYHPVFVSCNRAYRINEERRSRWCADCPKCRFVFLCLAPFVSRAELVAIFGGRDMFADPQQAEGFRALLGADGLLKPFECVGEPVECRVALSLLRQHPDWSDHLFVADPALDGLTATDAERGRAFTFAEGEHCLPSQLEAVAREV